ncbi:MAG: hypothetical protein H0V17_19940 [Deltaproteobacteria bacterium]|nr:hypothetical protein [Deltaproteobacteria bacterium]
MFFARTCFARDMGLLAVIAVAGFGGCQRRAPVTSCASDLSGEYESSAGRWMLIDHGPRVEAYPLFTDVPAAGDLEVAPRMIEWRRTADGSLRGETRRRYMKTSASCLARVPARITSCASDTLDIVLGDTAAPLSFTPCQFGRVEPAHVERWTHR